MNANALMIDLINASEYGRWNIPMPITEYQDQEVLKCIIQEVSCVSTLIKHVHAFSIMRLDTYDTFCIEEPDIYHLWRFHEVSVDR